MPALLSLCLLCYCFDMQILYITHCNLLHDVWIHHPTYTQPPLHPIVTPPHVCVLSCRLVVFPPSARRSPDPDPHRLNEDGELWLVYEGLKETNRCFRVLWTPARSRAWCTRLFLFWYFLSLFFHFSSRGGLLPASLLDVDFVRFSHSSLSVSQALVRCHGFSFHRSGKGQSKWRGLACLIDNNLSLLLT